MKNNRNVAWIVWLNLAVAAQLVIGAPTAPNVAPATQFGDESSESMELKDLAGQLAASDGALGAINKAIVQAASKGASADKRAVNAAKGIDLMDRQGGGPVAWREFYGKKATDFLVHDFWGYTSVPRPKQFESIYQANQTQIDSAKADIEHMGSRIDALLDRRKQLEARQSWLWARIAFSLIDQPDIQFRSLYSNELRADPTRADDNHPEPPQVKAMRSAVRYMRTIQHTVQTLSEGSDAEQAAAYATMQQTLKGALEPLRDSTNTFVNAAGVPDDQSKQMKKEIWPQAQRMQSLCRDMSEAYRAAAEEEKEEALYADRQTQRIRLQQSLFDFAKAVAEYDKTLTKYATAWDVQEVEDKKSSDPVPAVAMPAAAAPVEKPTAAEASKAAPAIPPGATPTTPEGNLSSGKVIDLLAGVRLPGDADKGEWTRTDQGVRSSPADLAKIRLQFLPKGEYDFKIAFTLLEASKEFNLVMYYGEHQFDWIVYPDSSRVGVRRVGVHAVPNDLQVLNKNGLLAGNKRHEAFVQVRNDCLTCFLDGEVVHLIKTDYSNTTHFFKTPPGTMAVLTRSSILIHSARVVEVSNVLPTTVPVAPVAVEARQAQSAPAAANAPIPAVHINDGKVVDLLKLVDPAKDKISGNWSVTNGILGCTTAGGEACLEFPYAPPEEYDYHVTFVRQDGNRGIFFQCVTSGQRVAWGVGNFSNTICGFQLVDGKVSSENETTKKAKEWIVNGVPHESLIKVRRDRVEAYLDGQLVSSLKTSGRKLTINDGNRFRNPDTLGIDSRPVSLRITSAEIVEITGEGKPLR